MAQATNGSTTNFTKVDASSGFYSDGALVAGVATTSISGAGAVPITGNICEITTTGANALTLADGSEGQRIALVMIVDGGNGTLTPSNFGSGSTITFDDAGDTADLLFTNGKWYFLGGTATIA